MYRARVVAADARVIVYTYKYLIQWYMNKLTLESDGLLAPQSWYQAKNEMTKSSGSPHETDAEAGAHAEAGACLPPA